MMRVVVSEQPLAPESQQAIEPVKPILYRRKVIFISE